MNLAQLSNTPSRAGHDMLVRVLETSQLLRLLQWRKDATNFTIYPVKASDLRPGLREPGEPNTKQPRQPLPKHGQQAILSEDLTIDETFTDDAEEGIANLDAYMRGREATVAQAFAEEADVKIFRGTATGAGAFGLGLRLDGTTDVDPWDSTFTINAASNSLNIGTESNHKTFLEALTLAITQVPNANLIALNKELFARIQTIAQAKHALTWSRDDFGKQVLKYNGIDLVQVADGAILNTEPSGHATPQESTTSLYVMRTADYNGVTMVSNKGFKFQDWKTMEDAPHAQARAELRFGPIIEAENAIRRMRYIQL